MMFFGVLQLVTIAFISMQAPSLTAQVIPINTYVGAGYCEVATPDYNETVYYMNIERGEQTTLQCKAYCPDDQTVTLLDITRRKNFKVFNTRREEIITFDTAYASSQTDQSCSQGAQHIHSNLTLTWNQTGIYFFQCVFSYHVSRLQPRRLCSTEVVIINVTEQTADNMTLGSVPTSSTSTHISPPETTSTTELGDASTTSQPPPPCTVPSVYQISSSLSDHYSSITRIPFILLIMALSVLLT